MVEPITAGTLVAAALAAGAAEVGKGVLGGIARDAYDALKGLAARVLGPAVELLESKPDSGNRAGTVAELVDDQTAPVREELRQLAEALSAALAAEGKGANVTTMFNEFRAYGGNQFNAPGGTQNFGTMPPKPTPDG